MKHAIVYGGYSANEGGILDALTFLSVADLLAAHPNAGRHETALRAMKPGESIAFDGVPGVAGTIWCRDVATPDDYPADVLALGQRFHDALLALASAIQTASHAPNVGAVLFEDVNRARAKASVGQYLAGALGREMFEPLIGEPMLFKTWCLAALDRIGIGAGPNAHRSDAAALARNMGLIS